jgi:simple sugar transport system permease protein
LYIVPFVVLAVGIGLGLLNGIITVKGRIPSFITTLGTMMLWRGILLGQSGGYPKPLTRYLIGNEYFVNVFTGVVGPVPIQAIWFGIFGLILGILLHFHKFGNWVYATGNNKTGARSMGINTDRVKIICFMIVGFLCAFTAMSISTHLRTSYPLAGHLYEMKAIAGSVIGGASLFGGIGSMPGILLGSLIVQMLENGLILIRLPAIGIQSFVGLATIVFVVINIYTERMRVGIR